ncbi:MAG: glycosyltransferase family 4 protein [Lachnospiraceae bacterium]|nr:glycosyltransferase family 4 protein [Lachnospiraceae bacterium]
MNVLMIGVSPKRVGGMWTVAEQYINNKTYNEIVNLRYIATSTQGTIIERIIFMIIGYIRIFWILNTKPIDILHIHMAEKGSTFRKGIISIWGKKKNKKVIIHLHAGAFMAWYNSVSEKKQNRIRKVFESADRFLVLGEYWKRELSSIIPREKIQVLYNGVNCSPYNPYNQEAKNIVYFGLLKKEKGTYDLINSIKLINNKLPVDTKVILCGNDLEGKVNETIEKLELNDRIILPGWLEGEERDNVFREAMIEVHPSYYEGLSMTVLEAMAMGIPVITTNISTMPEVLGKDGIMIEPGDIYGLSDEILKLSNNKELRVKVGENAFYRAKHIFSIDNQMKRTIEIYKELLREEK